MAILRRRKIKMQAKDQGILLTLDRRRKNCRSSLTLAAANIARSTIPVRAYSLSGAMPRVTSS
ncbi:MAG: hypothetical protein HGA43_03475 [Nitrospirae bacterium]|nr:hypothetical protein [Nitrospirota bacterium]